MTRTTTPNNKDPDNFISSGSTLFNLALTDNIHCGFKKGTLVNIVGDSSAGKTFLALTSLVTAIQESDDETHTFIYDDVETANQFNMPKLFGKFAEEIKMPPLGEFSNTIEDLFDNVMYLLEENIPFIYVVDSFDALDSEEDMQTFKKSRAKKKAGEKASGSYRMAKPKKASEMFRRICNKLEHTQSILIVISQTRDAIGAMFKKKTRSGGRALKFYSAHEVWLAVIKTLKSKKRMIGTKTRSRIKKNQITGKWRDSPLYFYYSYGVDDVRANIEFLVQEKYWKKVKQTIKAKEFDAEGTITTIIHHIEDVDGEEKLQELVGEKWTEIENSLIDSDRKPRFEE